MFLHHVSSLNHLNICIIASLVVAHCAMHIHLAKSDWLKAFFIAALLGCSTLFTGITFNSIETFMKAQPMFALGTFSLGLSVCCFATWVTRKSFF